MRSVPILVSITDMRFNGMAWRLRHAGAPLARELHSLAQQLEDM
jgi:hypothetical protein